MLVLINWQKGAPVRLSDYLRERHEEDAEAVRVEIARRKENGVPLDEHVRWDEVAEHAAAAAAAAQRKDAVTMRKAMAGALDGAAAALVEPPAFVAPKNTDEVTVTFRAIPDAVGTLLAAAVADAYDAIGSGDSAVKIAKAEHRLAAAMLDYLAAACALVEGFEVDDGDAQRARAVAPTKTGDPDRPYSFSDDDADLLRRMGLVGPLYRAAARFQRLPAKKAAPSGRSPQSISLSSSAVSAQSSTGLPEGVTEELAPRSLREPPTKMTPAPTAA